MALSYNHLYIAQLSCRAYILDSSPSPNYNYSEAIIGITEFLKACCIGKKTIHLKQEQLQVYLLVAIAISDGCAVHACLLG